MVQSRAHGASRMTGEQRLVLESVVRMGLAGVVGLVIARVLGPNEYGVLTYLLAIVSICGSLVSLGVPAVLVREVATGADPVALMRPILRLQLLAGLVAGAVLLGISAVEFGVDPEITPLAIVLAVSVLASASVTLRAYFEATGNIRTLMRTTLSASVLGTVAKVVALAIGVPLWILGAAIVSESVITFLGLRFVLPLRFRVLERSKASSRSPGKLAPLMREALPLLASSLAVLIYLRVDILMVQHILGARDTGIYAAAARVSELSYFLPVAMMAALRPRLAKIAATGDHAEYAGVLIAKLRQFAVISGFLTLVILAGARGIVGVLFGPEYGDSVEVLRIHAMSLPFVFIATHPWFVDNHKTVYVMINTLCGVIVNIGLNVALLPLLGVSGAALATVLSYGLAGLVMNAMWRGTQPLFALQVKAFTRGNM